jgi:type I restriction enzyme M protein
LRGNTLARIKKNATTRNNITAANVGYEAELSQMADALRGSMDAAEYKHVVLGLIFLKYISDAFEEQHARLEAERDRKFLRDLLNANVVGNRGEDCNS